MRKRSGFLVIWAIVVLEASSSIADGLFGEGLVDYATPPEQVADAIVVYTPNADMSLNKMELSERVLIGRIEKHEKGNVAHSKIVHRAKSMIMPLQAGVPVKLYLKHFSDRDAYYPIAIFPISSGVK